MAKNKTGFGMETGFDSHVPLEPTQISARFADGRILGIDNTLWLVRKVPLRPYADARSLSDQLDAIEPLMQVFRDLSDLAHSVGVPRRFTSRGSYRRFKLKLVNVPKFFEPDPDSPLAVKHQRDYGHHNTDERALLFAVQLKSSVTASGMRSAVDSVVETFTHGGTPLSDYDADAEEVDAILKRAGFAEPSPSEIRLADSWWSDRRRSDAHFAIHPDHLHVFESAAGARIAKTMDDTSCEEWPTIEGHNIVSIASVADFNLKFVPSTKPYTQWASDALRQGAIAVTVSGLIEPAKVSAEEMRRQHQRVRNDIEDRYHQGGLSKKQQDDLLGLLHSVSRAYEDGGFPTITEGSILIAFNGRKDERKIMRHSAADIRIMENRQYQGLLEMQLASAVKANPNRQELPSPVIAASGISSMNRVGDRSGAILGFDERDEQVAYVSPAAAYTKDSLPIMMCIGATGSGKLLRLDTKVTTPTGHIRMGDIAVGDTVIGRDGRPCTVTATSPITSDVTAYKVTLSDGQVLTADSNHQWVVSSSDDRLSMRRPEHMRALERADESRALAARIRHRAAQIDPATEMSYPELAEILADIDGVRFTSKERIAAVLDMMETPRRKAPRLVDNAFNTEQIVKQDPVLVYPAKQAVNALADAWAGTKDPRWSGRAHRRAAAARAALSTVPDEVQWTVREIASAIDAVDSTVDLLAPSAKSQIHSRLHRLGVPSETVRRNVTVPVGKAPRAYTRQVPVAPARRALEDIANRVLQQIAVDDAPYLERVMSTGEMVAEGVLLSRGERNWAIHVAQPIHLPEADLPVEPYTLGAWLGDGSTASNELTSIDSEIWENIEADGYTVWHDPKVAQRHRIEGLRSKLRETGFSVRPRIGDKHIPPAYLRASDAQRLALLQGLMDTDGTITAAGSCELSLNNPVLAEDALELIRSLGIKATMSTSPSSYRLRDPETGELGTAKVTGTRHRIHFTTDREVFRLARKKAHLPSRLRETHQWLYVESIEPVAPQPMRCISVDSPDATYLVDGFVPTHNTVVGLNLADQFKDLGNPVVFIDPKNHTDGEGHSPVVRAMGGQVASLDDLVSSDGIFDPVRFMQDADSAIETGTDLLLSINPWGSKKQDYEATLARALRYGIADRGATCLGQALKHAYDDGVLKGVEDIYLKCEELASLPQFGAMYGRDPQGTALNISNGITLIEVGKTHLPIPEPGQPAANITQRIASALVRMMVFGSANALTGRGGVVMLDEAWVFLSAGRAEMERLGRLARSQRVLPFLMTQRVTDALDAGLAGYISRGIILHLSDEDEARAACELFKVEATRARLNRITAGDALGGEGDWGEDSTAGLNPNSLKALVVEVEDPDFPGLKKREVVRGSVGYYSDLSGRFIPVENVLPDDFLMRASTNKIDIDRRNRVLAARARESAVKRRRAIRDGAAADHLDELFEASFVRPAGDSRPTDSAFDAKRQKVSLYADRSADLDADHTPTAPAMAGSRTSSAPPGAPERGDIDADDLF